MYLLQFLLEFFSYSSRSFAAARDDDDGVLCQTMDDAVSADCGGSFKSGFTDIFHIIIIVGKLAFAFAPLHTTGNLFTLEKRKE
jgi:hypothetical protein